MTRDSMMDSARAYGLPRECERRTEMGDAVIFMTGIALGSLVTMFILLVAMMTDEIRRNEWK